MLTTGLQPVLKPSLSQAFARGDLFSRAVQKNISAVTSSDVQQHKRQTRKRVARAPKTDVALQRSA